MAGCPAGCELACAKHDQRAQIGASIGVAFYYGGPLEPDSLVKRADSAMCQAKNQGKNTYRFAPE